MARSILLTIAQDSQDVKQEYALRALWKSENPEDRAYARAKLHAITEDPSNSNFRTTVNFLLQSPDVIDRGTAAFAKAASPGMWDR